MEWGGSGIEKVVFDFILSKIEPGSVVIELGAGHVSTQAFSKVYNTYSVEHNPEFIGHYDVKYIPAQIINGWYDRSALIRELPELSRQKLILIDGVNRKGILFNLDLFNPLALYVVHDTYRTEEKDLCLELSERLNRGVTFHQDGDFWASI